MHHALKVSLRAVTTTVDYKLMLKYLGYFIYVSLYVSISKDHHLMVYEYICWYRIIKMDPIFTFTNNIVIQILILCIWYMMYTE
jgi:hypothetical protein